MRILITGGSGLLAGRLAKFLSKHNSVTLLSRKNIKNILEADSVYTMHYQNQNDFNQNIIDHDIIIHASSPNAIDSKDINISKRYLEETKTLIDMASISKNVKKFIFLSSIRVVSDNYQGLITENMAVNPSSDYGKLKNEIETYLRVKKSANNMSKIILRITNGYGYPIHNLSDCWNLVVMNICKLQYECKLSHQLNLQLYKPRTENFRFMTITETLLLCKKTLNFDLWNEIGVKNPSVVCWR